MLKRALILGSLAGLGFLICFGIAGAIDPPHNFTSNLCNNCHALHNAAGASLTTRANVNDLCVSCHTGSGSASAKPFDPTDQANPGVSGTSHKWSGAMPATSAPGNQYGLRAYADIANVEMKARLATFCTKDTNGNCTSYNLACPVCHDPHSQSVTPWDPNAPSSYTFGSGDGRHLQRMANDLNQLCEDCHYYRTSASAPGGVSQTDVRTWDGNKKSHPVNMTLTSGAAYNATPLEPAAAGWAAQTGAPRYHQNGGTDTNATNNIVFDSTGKIRCLSCHGIHYTDSDSSTVDQP